jgi:hypothetical protein
MYRKAILHVRSIARINTSLNHVVELKLEDIHVVQEFLDVYPHDLPGLLPKRSIEFEIEL